MYRDSFQRVGGFIGPITFVWINFRRWLCLCLFVFDGFLHNFANLQILHSNISRPDLIFFNSGITLLACSRYPRETWESDTCHSISKFFIEFSIFCICFGLYYFYLAHPILLQLWYTLLNQGHYFYMYFLNFCLLNYSLLSEYFLFAEYWSCYSHSLPTEYFLFGGYWSYCDHSLSFSHYESYYNHSLLSLYSNHLTYLPLIYLTQMLEEIIMFFKNLFVGCVRFSFSFIKQSTVIWLVLVLFQI